MNPYLVIVWRNDGSRYEHDCATLAEAEHYARQVRILKHRTVKIGHCGDSLRHWSRTLTAKRNHWAKHSTAECAR